MSADGVTHSCSCRDADGRQLGSHCPKLKDRKHGRYVARYSVVGADGKRRQPSVSASTKTEARKLRAEIVQRLEKGETVDRRMTVGEWLDLWVAGKARSRRGNTVRSYQGHIDSYLKPNIGSVPLEALRDSHISAMIDKIVAENPARTVAKKPTVGPTTLHRINATLRCALNAAIKARRISHNPASFVELTPATKSEVAPWDATETGRFLDAVAGDQLGPLFDVMAMTGLRRGEALGLRWSDVDMAGALLVVRQQLVAVGHTVEFGEPKTKAGARTVDLDPGTVGTLLTVQLAQQAARDAWGTAWRNTDDLVFVREDGSPWHPNRVTVRFRELVADTGLRPIRLHDLRHGAASLALAAGVDAATVSKRLGHSSIAITVDIYSHLLKGVGADAAARTAAMVPRNRPASPAQIESAVIVQS